jgi:hypothetical protein
MIEDIANLVSQSFRLIFQHSNVSLGGANERTNERSSRHGHSSQFRSGGGREGGVLFQIIARTVRRLGAIDLAF